MEGGDLSCVCVSELRTRSVCSVECVTRGMWGVCLCACAHVRSGRDSRERDAGLSRLVMICRVRLFLRRAQCCLC